VARGLDRRSFLATSAAVVGGAAVPGAPAARTARGRRPPIGSGGTPMELPALARLARKLGGGYPVLMLDLAALDRNTQVVASFAREQGWSLRPALKSFRSPRLTAYLLRRLPEPRGLVFNLYELDAIVAAAPAGVDLMGGYPPTVGELRAFLRRRGPRKRHRIRLLVDSVPLLEELARLARRTPRRLPLDVALELDVGMGRGGMNEPGELAAAIEILRRERDRLRLGAVLGYDGHATLDGDPTYRKGVAAQAIEFYRRHLDELAAFVDPRTLIRNGPASSNYRNWVGGPANEISPGSAFLFAGYLNGGYDTEGLFPALTMAGAVRRITSDHPSLPLTGTSPPGATEQEIVVQGVGSAGEVVWPAGARGDDASGGGDALVVPKGSVALGDYVLYRPTQTEVGVQQFDAIVAVRDGTARRTWKVQPRPRGARSGTG
jgi:D-serine deaminase-like pyridoxal phosphate-dependent protein